MRLVVQTPEGKVTEYFLLDMKMIDAEGIAVLVSDPGRRYYNTAPVFFKGDRP